MVGTSDTGQDMHNRAESVYDVELDNPDLWARLMDMFGNDREQAEAYLRQLMNDQARALARDVPTRDGPLLANANYLAYDHQQLDSMVNQNANPGDVGRTGDMWIEAGNAMARFQTGVVAAINNSETEWQGTAANGARGFMADVGNWVGQAGQSAQLAGTQMNVQAEALARARNDMPAEVPYDRDEWVRRIMTSSDPWGTWSEAVEQYNQHNAAHREAARVVSTYDGGLAGASTMPAFTAPPTMSGGGGTGDGGDRSGVGTIDGQINNPPGSTGTGNYGGGGGPGSGSGTRTPTVPGPGGGPGGGGQGGNPGTTDPGGAGPGGPGSGPGGGSGLPGGGGPGSGPGGGHLPGLPIGGLPIGGGPGAGGDGESLRPGRGSGSAGFGPGGRGFGPGGSGGAASGFGSESGGSRAGGGGAGGMGRGPGGGMGPGGAGALAAEHAAGGVGAGRGGLGAGGRGGMGGMPMGMGGGRGQGDEDSEHQRPSYLVEGDPESVFGTDEMTAPPVIGE